MTWSGPALWLRVASVLTLLFAAGHAMGAADSWSPVGDTDVLRAMRAFEFEVMGVTRTYWHFYYGFGIYIAVLLALVAVVLWQLAPITHPALTPLIGSFAVATGAGTIVLWRFIFPMPALFSLLIAVSLSLAFAAARRRHLPAPQGHPEK